MNHDISNAIFTPNKNKADTNIQKTTLYTIGDYKESTDDNNNSVTNKDGDRVFAKKVFLQGRWKFFIRLDQDDKAYNPFNVYGNTNPKNNLLNRPDESRIKFKETSTNLFNLYLNFLQTKNLSLYNNVNRELV